MALCFRFIPLACILVYQITGISFAAPIDFSQGAWTVSPSVVSQYVFRGVKFADASLQPSIEYTAGPVALGVWSNVALDHREADAADPELDLYGSYIISTFSGALRVVPGFCLYTYPDTPRQSGLYSATFEPSLAAIFSAGGLQFTPKVYYDLTLRGATYELTTAIALPLKRLGTELDFFLTAGSYKYRDAVKDSAPRVEKWGDYWTFGVSVPVQISIQSRLTFSLFHSEGINAFQKLGNLPKMRNAATGGHTGASLSYSTSL